MNQTKGLLLPVFAFLLLSCSVANAQFYPTQYRPPALNWQQLKTPHFRIVFPAGEDSAAWQSAQILESQYAGIRSYVGGELSDFPVVLNNYTDISNGFVSPNHFRSEIFLSPFKGKALNPRSGNWLETIHPHELVHALHLSHIDPVGVSGVLNILSPDMARSMHTAIPAGIPEGIAVYHETHGPGTYSAAGRGAYPYFNNQFNAVFNSAGRWSMGQMVHFSTDTRPFNRHYIGGYEFVNWLQNEYGPETTLDAIDFYNRLPFLGYGVALRHATGRWPNQLYDAFESDKRESLRDKNLAGTQGFAAQTIDLPYEGEAVHRPKWLSGTELIFFGSFYNARPGFYTYDTETKKTNRIITTGSVDDFWYDLSPSKQEIVYSYYRSDARYDQASKAELVKGNLETGHTQRLTSGGRIYSPSFTKKGITALQTHHFSSRLVELDEDYSISPVASPGNMQIKSVAAHPLDSGRLAVVANKRGVQGLWLVSIQSIQEELQQPPDISFTGGLVFDPSWNEDGSLLLFTSDFSGTMNIYEYNTGDKTVTRLTNSLYNAFEASYAPGGSRISYIRQDGNEQKLALLNRADFDGSTVSPELWRPENNSVNDRLSRPVMGYKHLPSGDWDQNRYRSGLGWLKPRTLMPFTEEVSNRNVYQWGIGFYSNNLLQTQSYSAEISTVEGRYWYDLSYTNNQFFPGFRARYASNPAYRPFRFETTDGIVERTMLRQERRVSLSIPTQFTLDQNVYFTALSITPELRRSQIRYHELSMNGGGPVSEFADLTIANLFGAFYYRLQQNIRDLQPNSGLILFGEVEHYLSSDNVFINTLGNSYRLTFPSPTGFRGGLYSYLAPFREWNQSLRLGLLGLTQTQILFDNQSIVSPAFPRAVLTGSNNLLSFSTRYTIPLTYPDDGGFLLPLYLGNLYLVLFSNTVADPTQRDYIGSSRSVFGAGIRSRFRISNLSLDIGIGFGYEPSRNRGSIVFGNF